MLIGRVFDEGSRTFIVEDVGPSALQAGAPTVAFVVDVAHRVRATGRLDEQCEEREVQAVRAALRETHSSGSDDDSEQELERPDATAAASSRRQPDAHA